MFMLNILKPQMAVDNFIKVSDYVVVCPLLFTIASHSVLILDVILSVLRIFDTSVITLISRDIYHNVVSYIISVNTEILNSLL